MQFDLTIDLCQPGSMGSALAALQNSVPIAAAHGLKLEASWQTEFGAADEVVSLWSSPDGAGKEAAAFLSTPLTASSTRQHQPLSLEMPFDNDFQGGHIYDFRRYNLEPGTRETFLRHMGQALPVRKTHSRNVGVWTPRSGDRDIIIHAWAYKDLADRNRARGAAWQEPSWQAYLVQIFPLTRRMQNALLVPTTFSPMQ